MHDARTYTGQVTRLCTGIVLHERSRKMPSSAERGGEEGGITLVKLCAGTTSGDVGSGEKGLHEGIPFLTT